MSQDLQVEGIGRRIREARDELGMTQAQLALDIGVAARTVQSWELDERTPRLSQLRRLALRTNRTVAWFYENGDKAA